MSSSVRVDLKFKPISTSITSHSFVLIAENETRITEMLLRFPPAIFRTRAAGPVKNPLQRILVFCASWAPLNRCASFARTSFSRDAIHRVVLKISSIAALFLERNLCAASPRDPLPLLNVRLIYVSAVVCRFFILTADSRPPRYYCSVRFGYAFLEQYLPFPDSPLTSSDAAMKHECLEL